MENSNVLSLGVKYSKPKTNRNTKTKRKKPCGNPRLAPSHRSVNVVAVRHLNLRLKIIRIMNRRKVNWNQRVSVACNAGIDSRFLSPRSFWHPLKTEKSELKCSRSIANALWFSRFILLFGSLSIGKQRKKNISFFGGNHKDRRLKEWLLTQVAQFL